MLKRDKKQLLSFSSSLDYSYLVNKYPKIFIDYRQTFDLLYLINCFHTNMFMPHKEEKGYVSISHNKFKGISFSIERFNKIPNFDLVFDSIKNITKYNSYTELTFAYKLKDWIGLEISMLPTLERDFFYTRNKFKLKRVYKSNGNIYTSKKELIKGEKLSKSEVEKELWKYAYEIKDLAKENCLVPSQRPKSSYSHPCTLNIDNCRKIKNDVIDNQGETEFYQTDVLAINYYLHVFDSKGVVYQHYERKAGGRLVNFGGISDSSPLQNISKQVREIIFQGKWEIDIENSAPTILLQMAKKFTDLELPNIEKYIEDKEFYRNSLLQYDLTYSQSKELYIAIFFGASLELLGESRNSWAYKFGVAKIKHILESSEMFKNLYDDVRLLIHYLGLALKNNRTKKNDKGNLVMYNTRGSGKVFTKWDSKKALMHYYFGIESEILDYIIKNYQHDLLLYDAFITGEDVDVDKLSEDIEKELGYKVKFSKRKIGGKL